MGDYDLIPTHVTEVTAVDRISEHYLQVSVAGGLERYVSKGPDDFVYVLVPPPGRSDLTIGVDFTWTGFYEMPEPERPVGAYYSARRVRPDALDIEVFLHDEPGPASSWAASCQPGDPVALWGPRTAWAPPAEVDWWLLVADETGLPALARMVEELPVDSCVHAFVEVPDPSDKRDLPFAVTWLPRDGRPAGRTTQLLDAVQALRFPAGQPYVWGGGESRVMTSLRKHVRTDRGIPRERVSLTGYWRHAQTTDDEIADD